MSTDPAPLPVTTPVTTALLRGALDVERTDVGLLPHRLPVRARAQAPDGQIALAEAQPSGVRLVFRTRATVIELEARRTRTAYQGVPPRPDGVYDLLVDGKLAARSSASGGNVLDVDMATGSTEFRTGPVGTVRFDGLPGQDKDVELWLPFNERTELVALRTDAPVTPAPDTGRRVWLHHGSSISHGSDAASPTTIWPARAALLGGVELVNLGLGGSALLDPFTARAMRDTPADLISVKVGINIVNADVMRLRAFVPAVHGFLDTLREGHPDIPLLVISPVLCPIHEDTPGPSVPDFSRLGEGRVRFAAAGDPEERAAGKLTTGIIRDELAALVKRRSADDPHLRYLDGRELYGEADADELPLPDALHPDATTHLRMGDRFARLAFGADGPFGAA